MTRHPRGDQRPPAVICLFYGVKFALIVHFRAFVEDVSVLWGGYRHWNVRQPRVRSETGRLRTQFGLYRNACILKDEVAKLVYKEEFKEAVKCQES